MIHDVESRSMPQRKMRDTDSLSRHLKPTLNRHTHTHTHTPEVRAESSIDSVTGYPAPRGSSPCDHLRGSIPRFLVSVFQWPAPRPVAATTPTPPSGPSWGKWKLGISQTYQQLEANVKWNNHLTPYTVGGSRPVRECMKDRVYRMSV